MRIVNISRTEPSLRGIPLLIEKRSHNNKREETFGTSTNIGACMIGECKTIIFSDEPESFGTNWKGVWGGGPERQLKGRISNIWDQFRHIFPLFLQV